MTFHPYTAKEFVLRARAIYGSGDSSVSLWSTDAAVTVKPKLGGNG